jgi:hypothetical protein
MVEGFNQESKSDGFWTLKDVATEYPLYNGAACSGVVVLDEKAPPTLRIVDGVRRQFRVQLSDNGKIFVCSMVSNTCAGN